MESAPVYHNCHNVIVTKVPATQSCLWFVCWAFVVLFCVRNELCCVRWGGVKLFSLTHRCWLCDAFVCCRCVFSADVSWTMSRQLCALVLWQCHWPLSNVHLRRLSWKRQSFWKRATVSWSVCSEWPANQHAHHHTQLCPYDRLPIAVSQLTRLGNLVDSIKFRHYKQNEICKICYVSVCTTPEVCSCYTLWKQALRNLRQFRSKCDKTFVILKF